MKGILHILGFDKLKKMDYTILDYFVGEPVDVVKDLGLMVF